MSQPSWIGQTIGGRYKIEALLGQGGMSAVYRGSDPNLRRTVAIKLIHPHLSSDPEFARRFEQEAAAVAQLRHSNIIQVYDFNHDGALLYMVLEYVPGETLQAKLKALHAAGQKLPLAEVVRIMAPVCDAVAYAHQRGMIHRDLKPANVMLNPDGQPILMDFGVAKMRGGQMDTATGAIIGTATYMSPEQARGDHLDERADIYSLGIMMYEMVAGRPPFEGASAMTVMLKHLNEPPPDLHQLNQSVPDDLAAIIQKALAKMPADRFQSAREMATALRAVQASAPTMVQTAPTPAPTEVSAPQTQARTEATAVKQPQTTTATSPGAQVKKGAPIALFVGLGAVVLCVIIAAVVAVPLLGGNKPKPTATALSATATTGGVVVEVSPTSGLTEIPPTDTVAASTDTPPPAATPTATQIPIPEGMVLVHGGTFKMGSDKGAADEKPVHEVTLNAFLIDTYEVTNARYKKCVDAKACMPPAIKGSFTHTSYFGNPEFDNYPVVKVTWNQAAAFCHWEGKRLPTEAEWEYTATGGDGRRYPWGNDFDPNRLPANEGDTTEVGKYQDSASPFGVFDMAGNVVEWVADWYSGTYYRLSPSANPTGPETGSQRVMRGGSFGNPDGSFYTTTKRYKQGPGFHDVDIGFRCAANAP